MLPGTKITVFVLLASFIVFHHADAWRRRRRRRCTPRACEVSSWSSWSGCSADQCGQQGSQHRTRTVTSHASCGGTECPELDESRQCYSSQSVDCQLSSWTQWSACSTPCGVSGIQFSVRHRVVTEQCGGSCTSSFRKTRACQELSCLNGGSLKGRNCFCKEGFSGDCCEKGNSSKGALSKGMLSLVILGGSGGGLGLIALGIYCYVKYNRNRNQVTSINYNNNNTVVVSDRYQT